MKIFLTTLFAIFFYAQGNAQITDSTRVRNPIELERITKGIDTIGMINIRDLMAIEEFINSSDSIYLSGLVKPPKISDMIFINKYLLDSLLRPFYRISIDEYVRDTTYTPLYRMVVNDLTQDTMYVTVPKEKDFLVLKKSLVFDTLRIENPINFVDFSKTKIAATPVWWHKKNKLSMAFNEAAFVNWNSGGENSISGLFKAYFSRNYKKLHVMWNSDVDIRYGLNQQKDRELRKTDDKFAINSSFGYRKDTISNWYYTVKFNFHTQFTDGYKYPDTDNPISRLMAPGYLFFGAGSEYNLKKHKFSIFLSPLTLKSTFVLDDRLSDEGAFGVTPGQRQRHEFGILVQSKWNKEVFKNVVMNNNLGMYTDYLNNFGNIDVSWELNFNLKINKYLKTSLGAQLIYDDDIKHKEDINGDGQLETLGARVQIKQWLNIGVLFDF